MTLKDQLIEEIEDKIAFLNADDLQEVIDLIDQFEDDVLAKFKKRKGL